MVLCTGYIAARLGTDELATAGDPYMSPVELAFEWAKWLGAVVLQKELPQTPP